MTPPEAPFDAPWQAQAFALAVALNEAGQLDWTDWSRAFGAARAGDGDYFDDWVATLEGVLTARGIASPDEIAALASAWRRAAEATPHGVALRLENDPEGGPDGRRRGGGPGD